MLLNQSLVLEEVHRFLWSYIIYYSLCILNLACNCDTNGSTGQGCNENGQCDCKRNVIGKTCSQCAVSDVLNRPLYSILYIFLNVDKFTI